MAALEEYARQSGFEPNKRRFKKNNTGQRMLVLTRFYATKLTEMALSRFRWIGLPKEIDERYLEWTLVNYGLAAFTQQSSLGNRFFALSATPERGYNHYFNPTRLRAIGASGTPNLSLSTGRPTTAEGIANFKMDDFCVPIWGNLARVPDTDTITIYAEQLAQISRTIEVNILQNRTPYIVAVPETQKLAAVQVLNNLYDGETAVLSMPDFDINQVVQVMATGMDKSTILLDNILAKSKVWNEAMNMLGINNANQDKKERLVSAEVAANDDQILLLRNSPLSTRQLACEAINEYYDLHTKVVWRWHPDADRPDSPTASEGTGGATMFTPNALMGDASIAPDTTQGRSGHGRFGGSVSKKEKVNG